MASPPKKSRLTRAALAGAIAVVGSGAATAMIEGGSVAGASVSRVRLLPPSDIPPTMNDAKLFGIRNAIHNALRGRNVSAVNIEMVVNILATYWLAGKAGMTEAANELGVEANFEGPVVSSATTQISLLQNLLATGVTGYFLSVIDPAAEVSTIDSAVAKGIDVVAIDSPVPTTKAFIYVGSVNEEDGYAAGVAMKAALPGGGDVGILDGSLTASNAIERLQGFEAAIKGSNLTVTTTLNDSGSATTAASNAATLVNNPNIKGIYGVYSYDGPAGATVVKAKGDTGKIKVIAADTDPTTLTFVKEGVIQDAIIQQPYMQGYLGVYITTAMKILGKARTAALLRPFETLSNGAEIIDTGVGTIDAANLAGYNKYNKEVGLG